MPELPNWALFALVIAAVLGLSGWQAHTRGPRHPGGRTGYVRDAAVSGIGRFLALLIVAVTFAFKDALSEPTRLWMLGIGFVLLIGGSLIPGARDARARLAGLGPRPVMQYGDEVR